MADSFTNWSGSLSCTPRRWIRASTVDEVAGAVQRAADEGLTLRPLGSGHSSMPLMTTQDVLLSVDDMRGVTSADPDAGLARVLPGTGLAELGAELARHGLAMENLGDVDYQSIAGAIGTGTHGTGARLGNLSSTLAGGTMVTGTGEVRPFGVDAPAAPGAGGPPDDDDDVVRAAGVALGSLGVLTELTLRVLPAYDLHRTNWMTHIDWVLENLDQLIEENRHVDFYWYPRSDLAQVRILNRPGEEPDLLPPGELLTDETGATLAQMFPGRFWVALGSGQNMNEHITGDEWVAKDVRQHRLEECVEVIRRLHAGEEVSHRGLIEVDRARIYSLPDAPPPLLGPALTPGTARRAAAWADGLITVNSDLESMSEIVGAYRGAGGRGPLALQVHISIADTLDQARELARDQWRNNAVDSPLDADLATPEELDAAGRYVPDEKIAQAVIVTDSVDQLVGRLRGFEALGFTRIYLHHVARDQAPFLELAQTTLLPELHGST